MRVGEPGERPTGVKEVLARFDYKSVRAAAKDAGIVKDPTPLQRVQAAWGYNR